MANQSSRINKTESDDSFLTPALPQFASYGSRLSTFDENWDGDVSPEELAGSGFYYTQMGDICGCAYCRVHLENWKAYDIVHEEHHKHSKGRCAFLNTVYTEAGYDGTDERRSLCVDITPRMFREDKKKKRKDLDETDANCHLPDVLEKSSCLADDVEEDGDVLDASLTRVESANKRKKEEIPPLRILAKSVSDKALRSRAVHICCNGSDRHVTIGFKINMYYESCYNRYKALSKCKPVIAYQAMALARAGFYPEHMLGLRVKCFYCKVTLDEYKHTGNPFAVHYRVSPSCGYLRAIASI